MGKLKFIFFVAQVFCLSNFTFANTGCLYSSGYIYTVSNGTYYGNPPGPSGLNFYPNYRYSLSSDRIIDTNVFCKVTSQQPCRIDGSAGDWGTLITFTITQCPLDDYTWLLILPLGSFGFFLVREKRSLS